MEGLSLSRRLRDAALERARHDGELVDSYVLDADGVLDLRTLDDDRVIAPATQPAAALARTLGRLGDAGEVSDLYNEPNVHRPWSRTKSETAPAASPVDADPRTPDSREPTIALSHPAASTSGEATIDLTDGDRPTKPCPECRSTGHLDLFDRFSQVEFYSCDDCLYMWQITRND